MIVITMNPEHWKLGDEIALHAAERARKPGTEDDFDPEVIIASIVMMAHRLTSVAPGTTAVGILQSCIMMIVQGERIAEEEEKAKAAAAQSPVPPQPVPVPVPTRLPNIEDEEDEEDPSDDESSDAENIDGEEKKEKLLN